MGLQEFGDENYVLTVMNTTETARGGLVRAVMDFPVKENVIGFDIVDNDGKPADYDVLSHEKTMLDVFSPINLPGVMDVDRLCCAAERARRGGALHQGLYRKAALRRRASCRVCRHGEALRR